MNNQATEQHLLPDDAEIAQFESYQREFWVQHLSGNKRVILVDDDNNIVWPTGIKIFLWVILGACALGTVLNLVSFVTTIINAVNYGSPVLGTILSCLLCLIMAFIMLVNAYNTYGIIKNKSKHCFSALALGYALTGTGIVAALIIGVVLSDYFPYMSEWLPDKVRNSAIEKLYKKFTPIAGKLINRYSL